MSTRSTRRFARHVLAVQLVGGMGFFLTSLLVGSWDLDAWQRAFVCGLGAWVLLDLADAVGLL